MKQGWRLRGSQGALEWLDGAVGLGCRSLPGLGWRVGQVQLCQPSQGLHCHLLSGRGSPGSCAEGLTPGAAHRE